ncbi:S1C family serine protease [Mycobacterium sp.]|uniref:S1C family serine protease n=1 Tax=Mycobacterium sp. TaxID=1785 RepID=UPI003D6A4F25
MSGSHRRTAGWWSWLLSLVATVGLVVAAAPVQASPLAPSGPRAPAPPADPLATVSQVGPQIVDIDTKMGYQSAVGAGTGIVIDPNGQVLTNNHVISGATDISARSIGTGQTYPVEVIGYDRSHDIAVLQLGGASGLPAAKIGDSSKVSVGDPIVSLGNAGGAGGTPSAVSGTVVALNQTVSASDSLTGSSETLDGLIQVDAGIRPGDSGGPTVNSNNQVIGMNTAASDNYKLSGAGTGFAIPINQAMGIAGQIRSGASSPTVHIGPTGFLGVGVSDSQNGPGVLVQRVLANAPAAQAGVAQGDRIVAIDNQPVNSATALTDILDQHHPGDTIALGLQSGSGGPRTQNVTLAPGPPG